MQFAAVASPKKSKRDGDAGQQLMPMRSCACLTSLADASCRRLGNTLSDPRLATKREHLLDQRGRRVTRTVWSRGVVVEAGTLPGRVADAHLRAVLALALAATVAAFDVTFATTTLSCKGKVFSFFLGKRLRGGSSDAFGH